jgi:diaminopimelate decarboxylase
MAGLSEEALAEWGVCLDAAGTLAVEGVSAIELANRFGTPLHVVNYRRLQSHASSFVQAFRSCYGAPVEVYFAAKCNPVAGILDALLDAELGVEVFTPFELRLAQRVGCPSSRIIINGPAKTRQFLEDCIDATVRYIVADSCREVERIAEMARGRAKTVNMLLRANIGYVPRGMNPGSATASHGSVFGMAPEELAQAARLCQTQSSVRFQGLHMHIGSGIRHAADYREASRRLCQIALRLHSETGAAPACLDIGGGFGTAMVQEFSSLQFGLYHGLSRPPSPPHERLASFGMFAEAIAEPIMCSFRTKGLPLPLLALEPGRCLVSSNQMLLLRVVAIKHKSGRRDYLLTDGGQMPVNFPTFYEYHAVLCCREPFRAPAPAVDIVGSGCHSADFVRRNIQLPAVREGDFLAVMDSGAYFISFEGNFSFPRAAVVAVRDGTPVLLRRAETFEDMLAREVLDTGSVTRAIKSAPNQ